MNSGSDRRHSSSIPTVIAHFGGAPDYLKLALKSAEEFGNPVVMLGDDSNRDFWHHHRSASQMSSSKYDEFVRTYTKMSDYGQRYEMAFWRRPFAVEEWMRNEGVRQVFLLDSDVITFSNYSHDVAPFLPDGCQTALMTVRDQHPYDWCTSLHFSYWTIESLTDFTNFCIEAYCDAPIREQLESKFRWHVQNKTPGGVCEMTLLYLWSQRDGNSIFNFAKAWSSRVGDLAIESADNYFQQEYRQRLQLKRFTFRNGIPYAYNRVLGQDIRFLSVHCQGRSKGVMRFLRMRATKRCYASAYRIYNMMSSARLRARMILRPVLGH